MSQSVAPAAVASSWRESLRLYLDITRPRVMALVVFTGLPALLLGKEAWPSLGQTFWVLLGTAFAGGASSAFNAYIERDADARMARTRRRPLPAASVVPGAVVAYGAFLTVASMVILYAIGGAWPAFIALATIAFYVGVYTIWLKPRTPQNIVIGGAAGGTAPLIASAAMDGSVSLGAWILFLIIFLWTPPHFWGIALYRKKEYEAAGFPMMPSVVGDQPTRWRSLAYTLLLVPVTLAPWALGYLSVGYGLLAAGLGAWFTWIVVDSMRAPSPRRDHRVFAQSIVYLSFLFLAMLVDLALQAAPLG
ncbi:MAG: heme o synthase [Myxococcales bacterium]|nr:heme o synthase [Myxococcales bacterium]MCB9672903.1 protoheme IX farnesyltransferase [Alphaproteobacteria bacterium]MCB9693359.1 protoheme IX farnesyltransferase [Alphaproteobacteria bacterium]